MENFIGIYRNYCNQTKIKKCCIVFHIIFVQTLFYTCIVFGDVYFLLNVDISNHTKLTFAYYGFILSSLATCLLDIMCGIFYSRDFTSYIDSIKRVTECFKDDKKLINHLNKLHWFGIICTVLSIAFAVFRSLDTILTIKYLAQDKFVFVSVLVFVSKFLIKFAILFQQIMMFTFIVIVVLLSKCFHSFLSVVQKIVGSCDITLGVQCDITKEQIQSWVELYRELVNCCEKVTLCFGRQVLNVAAEFV